VHENDRRFRPRVVSDVDPVLVPLNKSLLVGHHSLGFVMGTPGRPGGATTRLRPLSKSIRKRCSRSSFCVTIACAARDEVMPYSPKQKRETREKILESARRLFNRKGYSGVSIEEIMSAAGLTHGGFYRHFAGKDELYAAAVRQFLCTNRPPAWQMRHKSRAVTKPRAQRIVDAYFSREHFDDREGCCPLLGMASDVQRGGKAVKAAYQEVVEQMVKVFEDHRGRGVWGDRSRRQDKSGRVKRFPAKGG